MKTGFISCNVFTSKYCMYFRTIISLLYTDMCIGFKASINAAILTRPGNAILTNSMRFQGLLVMLVDNGDTAKGGRTQFQELFTVISLRSQVFQR